MDRLIFQNLLILTAAAMLTLYLYQEGSPFWLFGAATCALRAMLHITEVELYKARNCPCDDCQARRRGETR